jgi:magnesium chelatase subunit I
LKAPQISTLGQLKATKYSAKTIREEMRDNLLKCLKAKKLWYSGIVGYEETVIPQLEAAILAGHNINFLGLRGQAKTKMARMMVNLLDEYVPVIKGSLLNEDPLQPISKQAKEQIERTGDDTAISWLHRNNRYSEKLATPDVSVADLIGDIDPIKAMNLKLSFADDDVIHYGLIPRSNRGIFVINELPDLQARIQVALFNVLQEKDVQIRGFNIRLPLDVAFVFTANPEDYTNRGSIVTPLKDRIQSQILTHYPSTLELGLKISDQESITPKGAEKINLDFVVKSIVEQVAVEARNSDYVDEKSGVSARLTISLREAVLASALRRKSINADRKDVVRISDIFASIQAINGKVELVYEGEQEGPERVSKKLISDAIATIGEITFAKHFNEKGELSEHLNTILAWFQNNHIFVSAHCPFNEYQLLLDQDIFDDVVELGIFDTRALGIEVLLHTLASLNKLNAHYDAQGADFSDLFKDDMFDLGDDNEDY